MFASHAERDAEVIRLRTTGLVYEAIATMLGISKSRAGQILRDHAKATGQPLPLSATDQARLQRNAEIVALVRGTTTPELVERFGIGPDTIKKVLLAAGIKRKRRPKPQKAA
jgi:transposase